MGNKKYYAHFLVIGVVIVFFTFSFLVFTEMEIIAETTTGTTTETTTVSCSYDASLCSKWGECQIGDLQYCEEFEKYPEGCRELSDPPLVYRSCTYNYPICEYTCLEWGSCRSDGTKECVRVKVEPEDCAGGTPPAPKTCTVETPPCEYTYTDWSVCDSSGYQYRKVESVPPENCSGTPILKRINFSRGIFIT